MAISEQTPQEAPKVKGTSEKLEELHRLKEEAMLGGGIERATSWRINPANHTTFRRPLRKCSLAIV